MPLHAHAHVQKSPDQEACYALLLCKTGRTWVIPGLEMS